MVSSGEELFRRSPLRRNTQGKIVNNFKVRKIGEEPAMAVKTARFCAANGTNTADLAEI
jgi:hypothetical protein